MIGNGLDISNWQMPLTPEICAAWYASGVRYVIVGCQRPDIARQQILMLRAAGIEVVGVYAYLYWGYDVGSETQNAIDIAIEFGIHAPDWIGADVFLDCENGGELPGVGVDTRNPQLESCVAQVQGHSLRPGIYTGQPFWEDSMGNSTDFASLALWFAAYYYNLRIIENVNFGGWKKAKVHQVTATGNTMYDLAGNEVPVPALDGMSVDYDQFFDSEDDMTLAQDVQDIKNLLAGYGYRAPDGSVLTGDPAWEAAKADGSSLFLGLGNTQSALTLLQKQVNGEILTDAEKAQVTTLIQQILAASTITPPGG